MYNNTRKQRDLHKANKVRGKKMEKAKFSEGDKVFVLRNHNGRFLGEFKTKADALEEKDFYEYETGNYSDLSIESYPAPEWVD